MGPCDHPGCPATTATHAVERVSGWPDTYCSDHAPDNALPIEPAPPIPPSPAQRTIRSTPGLCHLEAEARAALSRAGITTADGVTWAELVRLSLATVAVAPPALLKRIALGRER